jgi:hypothetical protein
LSLRAGKESWPLHLDAPPEDGNLSVNELQKRDVPILLLEYERLEISSREGLLSFSREEMLLSYFHITLSVQKAVAHPFTHHS